MSIMPSGVVHTCKEAESQQTILGFPQRKRACDLVEERSRSVGRTGHHADCMGRSTVPRLFSNSCSCT